MASQDRRAASYLADNHPERLLTEREAADRLNLSPLTLRRWRWAGSNLPFLKLGSAVRYDPVELDAFVEAGRRQCTSEGHNGE